MDSFDDVSTSGRVTRSLRKRLISVDSSDAGSRPTTPQLTKLVSIPELSSPARSLRTTRRNSTNGNSTPSKTPTMSRTSTISDSKDIENSFSGRAVRKRVISGTDCLTPMKTSKIEELSEEENNLARKNTPARRSTRLPSKSPTLLEVEKTPVKKLKPGPKSRRSRQFSESDSEVEVINLEENAEKENKAKQTKSPTRISPRLKAKSVSPKKVDKRIETIDLMEENVHFHDDEEPNEHSRLEKDVVDHQGTSKTIEPIKKITENSDKGEDTNIEIMESNLPEMAPVKKNDLIEIVSTNVSLELPAVDTKNDTTVNTPKKSTSPKTDLNLKNQEGPCVESVVMLHKLSPEVIAKLYGGNAVKNSPPNTKSVTFNDITGEYQMLKNIYPKTPTSIKSKSYIAMIDSSKESEDKSFRSDKGYSASFKDASAYNDKREGHGNQSKESVEFHDATNGPEEDNFENAVEIIQETPQKQKLHTKLQSSTPMDSLEAISVPEPQEIVKTVDGKPKSTTSSPDKSPIKSTPTLNDNVENTTKQEKKISPLVKEEESTTTVAQKQVDEEETSDNSVTTTAAEPINSKGVNEADLFSKSWTHNVIGCATSAGKIDTIAVAMPENKADEDVNFENFNLADMQKTLTAVNAKDTISEESEEEGSLLKLEFVDDEAWEAADNYESGDSMDEEERKEMEENELLDEGESIGSEDTVSDGSNEDADENASFITSDSNESLPNYSDEDVDLPDQPKKCDKSNGRSRILITSESEGEEVQTFDDKNKIKEIPNGNSEKKGNRLLKSNTRNRVLDTESENEDVSESIPNKANGCIDKNSEKSGKPFNIQVSKMLDETSNEEVSVIKSPQKTQNAINEGTINDLIDEAQDQNLFNNGCDNDSGARLNQSREKNSGESLKAVYNGLDELNESNNSKIREEYRDKTSSDVNTNIQNVHTDIFDNSCVRKERENSREAQTERKIRKSLNTTETSAIPQKISDHAEEMITTTVKKSSSHNTSELTESTTDQNQKDENNDANELTGQQTQNILYQTENIEDEDIEIPETQEAEPVFEDTNSDEIVTEESADENSIEDTVYIFNEPKQKNAGLSVSFCQAKQSRNSVKIKESVQHTSFTIGVNVIQRENDIKRNKSDSSELLEKEHNGKGCNVSNDSGESGTDNTAKTDDVHVCKEDKQCSILDRKRKSIASLDAQDAGEMKNTKKPNRKSLQLVSGSEFNPSQSLIENTEDCKRELKTQKAASKSRLSKSFCEPVQDRADALMNSSSSGISGNESENEKHTVTSSTPPTSNKNKRKDLGHILDRCDEIIEAANRAKLESKKNYKKSMAICPKSKKSAKHSVPLENGSEMAAPTAKDEKHSKEKITLALEQAFKASAKILMCETGRNKKEKLQANEEHSADRRLPVELLETLSNSELPIEIKKSHKETHSAFVQRMKYATGEIVEETVSPPRKKRAIFNKFELPTGTVLEEPITPKKKTNNSGFRESPITPRTLGFKVRHILTAGQDKAPEMQTSRTSKRKRKQTIDEPKRVLPKPQWSQSGVFLEEVLPSFNDKQIHKFKGASLTQTIKAGAGTATLNALSFKNSAMFRKNITRESAHELVTRNERQFARNHF